MYFLYIFNRLRSILNRWFYSLFKIIFLYMVYWYDYAVIYGCLFFPRLISYLFHAHKHEWICKSITFQDYDAAFIHGIVVGLLRDVNKCLREYGELACVYMYSSVDGHLEVSCYSKTECCSLTLLLLVLLLHYKKAEEIKHG